MKYKETSKRLKDALDRKGMKAAELSRLSQVNKGSISQYINGSHSPSNTNAVKMAHVLGVNPVWLMGFDVPMIDETSKKVNELAKSMNAIEILQDAFERTGYYDRKLAENEIKVLMKYTHFIMSEEER